MSNLYLLRASLIQHKKNQQIYNIFWFGVELEMEI